MPEEYGNSRGAPAARAKGGSPGPEEDDEPPLAPATASVAQLKGMAPKPEFPISLEADGRGRREGSGRAPRMTFSASPRAGTAWRCPSCRRPR